MLYCTLADRFYVGHLSRIEIETTFDGVRLKPEVKEQSKILTDGRTNLTSPDEFNNIEATNSILSFVKISKS